MAFYIQQLMNSLFRLAGGWSPKLLSAFCLRRSSHVVAIKETTQKGSNWTNPMPYVSFPVHTVQGIYLFKIYLFHYIFKR